MTLVSGSLRALKEHGLIEWYYWSWTPDIGSESLHYRSYESASVSFVAENLIQHLIHHGSFKPFVTKTYMWIRWKGGITLVKLPLLRYFPSSFLLSIFYLIKHIRCKILGITFLLFPALLPSILLFFSSYFASFYLSSLFHCCLGWYFSSGYI